MQLVQALVDRFYLVPLPKETYMKVHENSYRIFQVGKDRIWYALEREGSPVNVLTVGQERSLTIVRVTISPPKKVTQKQRYVFDCRFTSE
jgi:hypothetical protein